MVNTQDTASSKMSQAHLVQTGGGDFKAVLEAIIGIKEEGAEVPPPDGRWAKLDILLGTGWSLAYRVFDAQYWGVPQRRARIYLVADFDGESAGEVLFKSEGLSGYTSQGFRSWERAAGSVEESIRETGCSCLSLEHHPADSRIKIDRSGTIQTLTERMGTGGGNVPLIAEPVVSLEGNVSNPGCNQGGGCALYLHQPRPTTMQELQRKQQVH